MDKLASRHAITELVNWISLMERVIEEDEENLKGAVGSKVIQEYLQRYKVTSFNVLPLVESTKGLFFLSGNSFPNESIGWILFYGDHQTSSYTSNYEFVCVLLTVFSMFSFTFCRASEWM